VRFIGRHQGAPFFLYLAYNAPHSPLQSTELYLSRFSHIKDVRRRTYAAMVSAVDDGVGKILNELRRRGLEKHTLIFFLSDNGGPTADNRSDNSPLRAGKGSPWEGGIRVPFAAQWPGRIPAGLTYDRPVISMDIFATIAASSHSLISSARPLDGVNLIPYLTGEKTGDPHEALYLRMFDKGAFAVRDGRYKLVVPQTGASAELYDLSQDVAEKHNLAAERQDVVKRLETLRVESSAHRPGLRGSPARPPKEVMLRPTCVGCPRSVGRRVADVLCKRGSHAAMLKHTPLSSVLHCTHPPP